MQRFLTIPSKLLSTGFHPSMERHQELLSRIKEICPRLNTIKFLLLSMMKELDPSHPCDERIWKIAEQSVETTRQISGLVETAEESLPLFQAITQLENLIVAIQVFIQTKPRSGDLVAQSSVLATQLTTIPETFKKSALQIYQPKDIDSVVVRSKSSSNFATNRTSVIDSETDLNAEVKFTPSASHFSGAQNSTITGGTYLNVFGNYIMNTALSETKDPGGRLSPAGSHASSSSQNLVNRDFDSSGQIAAEQGSSTAEEFLLIPDIPKTRERCTGFPSGIFRIRADGTDFYWTPHLWESYAEGNSFCIWPLNRNHVAQVFSVNSKGNLCCGFGAELDVMGNAVIITHDRQRTEPWPNPWSHPLPTFSYSTESKLISVKFYADPLISDYWPRAESEWKDKEFVLAASSRLPTEVRGFREIAKWAPASAKSSRQWSTHLGHRGDELTNLAVEEKLKNMTPRDFNRLKWEIETP